MERVSGSGPVRLNKKIEIRKDIYALVVSACLKE